MIEFCLIGWKWKVGVLYYNVSSETPWTQASGPHTSCPLISSNIVLNRLTGLNVNYLLIGFNSIIQSFKAYKIYEYNLIYIMINAVLSSLLNDPVSLEDIYLKYKMTRTLPVYSPQSARASGSFPRTPGGRGGGKCPARPTLNSAILRPV